MKKVTASLLTAFLWPAAVFSGPAETPPQGFEPPEYIDSTGCAFWKMNLGDTIVWAERLGPDAKPICGLVPSIDPPSVSDRLTSIPPTRRGDALVFPVDGVYAQVVSVRSAKKADELTLLLQAEGFTVLRQDFIASSGALRTRVLFVGPFGEAEDTQERRKKLRKLGFGDAFLRIQAPE